MQSEKVGGGVGGGGLDRKMGLMGVKCQYGVVADVLDVQSY